MKILVLGAGIAGVTAAYALARDGHEVTVIDRQLIAGNETSFANAGLISPGHAYSWASPAAPKLLAKSLFRGDTAIRFRPLLDLRQWSFALGFLANCTTALARANTARKVRLCLYSQRMLAEFAAETGIAFDRQSKGLIYLYRTPEALDVAIGRMRVLTEGGVRLDRLDRAAIARTEPALAHVAHEFAGALHCPSDESGDCHLFTSRLAEACSGRGVAFRFGVTVTALRAEGDCVVAAATDQGDIAADAFVLAFGPYSPHLARTIGVPLNIYPVKGYSVTLAVDGRNAAPSIGGVDEASLVGWSRLGDRLRMTSVAEIGGYSTAHAPADFAAILAAGRRLFPDGADFSRPAMWAGLRPMTPSSLPLIGRTRHRNLWLDTGHGSLGWTMSCGTAMLTADLIAGRTPAIDASPFIYAG